MNKKWSSQVKEAAVSTEETFLQIFLLLLQHPFKAKGLLLQVEDQSTSIRVSELKGSPSDALIFKEQEKEKEVTTQGVSKYQIEPHGQKVVGWD